MNEIEQVKHDLLKGLTPTGRWRTVIERSVMINNDECVLYSDSEVVDVDKHFGGMFGDPKIVFSRPVFAEEKLDASGCEPTSCFDEKVGELTRSLDAVFSLGGQWKIFEGVGWDMGRFLVHYCALSYYDCMSGGMPFSEIRLARELMLKAGVNPKTKVYPGKKGDEWYTVGDFFKETAD